ncbi:MAG: tRNA (adenosine(37)-N6)-threonylcarbamoyltransferase complex ATPase subunit type 1 TsaE [Anaerolineales bacterium]
MSPILTDRSFDIITHSAKQTRLIGERLGYLLEPGSVVCLQGALGTGKTCLTQGIGAGMGVKGVIHSPTFVYINEHAPRGSGPYLYHVDLYRIQDYMDALALGIEDYIYGNGVTIIEWAERAQDIMPEERLWITISYLDYDSKRRIQFEASGEEYIQILLSLKGILWGKEKSRIQIKEAEE